MSALINVLVAETTSGPTTPMTVVRLHRILAQSGSSVILAVTGETLLQILADGAVTCLDGLKVTDITFLTVEFTVAIGTTSARLGHLTEGCLSLQGQPIRASVAFATPTPDLLARMLFVIVRLETFVTVVAEVCTLQKAREGITTV